MAYRDIFGSTVDIFFGDFLPDTRFANIGGVLFVDDPEIPMNLQFSNFSEKTLAKILSDWDQFKVTYEYSETINKWMKRK